MAKELQGDTVKANQIWSQLIAKEKRSYQPAYKPLETILKSKAEAILACQAVDAEHAHRDRPSSAPAGPRSRGIQLGDSVRISGMSRRKELNGVSGVLVHQFPDETGRVCVHIPSSSPFAPGSAHPDAGKVMRVRADRLRASADRPSTASSCSTAPTALVSPVRSASCSGSVGRAGHDRRRSGAQERGAPNRRRPGLYASSNRHVHDLLPPSGPPAIGTGHRGFDRKATGGFYRPRGTDSEKAAFGEW